MNNEKEGLKLLIEKQDKQVDLQKSLVEMEVQTLNIHQVFNLQFINIIQLIAMYNINLGKKQ